MGAKKFSTSIKGIRYREHATRKHGVKKDRYYFIRFQYKGKRIEEGAGWASEGMTLTKATAILAELKEAARLGKGATTLNERRAVRDQKKAEEAARIEAEQKAMVTFGDFFTDQYMPRAKQIKKPNSWRTEQTLFDNWLLPSIGPKTFNEIAFKDIEQIRWKMQKAKRSQTTIKYAIATARQTFKYAAELDIFKGENPASKMKFSKVDNKRDRFLTQSEARQLLEALMQRSPQVRDIAYLSLYSGLRSAEIFNLKWTDIDFDSSLIAVRDTKSGKNRHVPMTAGVAEMLRGNHPATGYIFRSTTGEKIKLLSRTFARTVEAAGLNDNVDDTRQKIVFHSLRHTFASWLVQSGTPLYTVGELLGHSSLEMTKRYSHLAPDNMRDAISNLEAIDVAAPESTSKVVSIQNHK